MSTSVRFASNLIAEPESLCSRDGNRFVYCVAFSPRFGIDSGEWVNDELIGQRVRTGTAVNHIYHYVKRVVVNRWLRKAAWRDGETGGKRIEPFMSAGNRFGEVGVSLKYDGARVERRTALAATTEI